MNFFFGIKNKNLKSTLTIPRFQNKKKTQKNYLLYSAEVKNNSWEINLLNSRNNNDFFFLEKDIDNNKIFFLAKKEEVELWCKKKFDKLINLNIYTDTSPAFRANLQIYLPNGGFSSYQSEYPFSMTLKKGNILSPISSLANEEADKNFVFIKNIYQYPVQEKFEVFFVDIKTKKILFKQTILSNTTNEVEIKKEFIKPDIFLFTKNFIGIPIYTSIHKNHVSFEHTHPPHEYILSGDKFKKITELKLEINAIIS
jgi:hypothetical protein